jgi:hypothetical protein
MNFFNHFCYRRLPKCQKRNVKGKQNENNIPNISDFLKINLITKTSKILCYWTDNAKVSLHCRAADKVIISADERQIM